MGYVSETAPVRHIHLGLGAFHRAHQAAYVDELNQLQPDDRRGIWAFTLQRSANVFALKAQGHRYTLVERGTETDRARTITSIVRADDANHGGLLADALADPALEVVTTAASQRFYVNGPDGGPDLTEPIAIGDLRRLNEPGAGSPLSSAGRLIEGFRRRRQRSGGPLAVVSCDRGRDNGGRLGRAVAAFAEQLDPDLADWIGANVTFCSSVSDRMIPRISPDDMDIATRPGGWADAVPVIAEPFRSWIIAGTGDGLPDWTQVGVKFVDDLEPYERRKDWLVGAAELILSGAGRARGHETLAAALADPRCREVLEPWWDQVVTDLSAVPGLDAAGYRDALRVRLSNQRLAHPLVTDPHSVHFPDWILDPLRHQLFAGQVEEFQVEALSAACSVAGVARRHSDLTALLDAGEAGRELVERAFS